MTESQISYNCSWNVNYSSRFRNHSSDVAFFGFGHCIKLCETDVKLKFFVLNFQRESVVAFDIFG
jgi:hypothetical protein